MEFKDYYATLGLERTATQDEIKRAYRKLARKYHPDVSKEAHAEARFKDLAEAYEALNNEERRAAYDDAVRHRQQTPEAGRAPGQEREFEFSGRGFDPGDGMGHSDFFESLFGRQAPDARPQGRRGSAGEDHHAKLVIDLEEAYQGASRTISLRMPVADAQGQFSMQERQLEVNIPQGVREGQHLRLAGQGQPGNAGGPSGDLYLEVAFRPHAHFKVDGRDIYIDLPISPWEAALGAQVTVPTPAGQLQLTVPPGSSSGRKLRLKGRGLPGKVAGDLYAVLGIAVPVADSAEAKKAYETLANAFPHFNPRRALEA
jgi:curved DNA-binding protein